MYQCVRVVCTYRIYPKYEGNTWRIQTLSAEGARGLYGYMVSSEYAGNILLVHDSCMLNVPTGLFWLPQDCIQYNATIPQQRSIQSYNPAATNTIPQEGRGRHCTGHYCRTCLSNMSRSLSMQPCIQPIPTGIAIITIIVHFLADQRRKRENPVGYCLH